MDRRQFFMAAGAAVAAPTVISKSIAAAVQPIPPVAPLRVVSGATGFTEIAYITRTDTVPSLVLQLYSKKNKQLISTFQNAQNASLASMVDNMKVKK